MMNPLPLFLVTLEDGTQVEMAQVRRSGIEAQMVDLQHPGEIIKVNINQRTEINETHLRLEQLYPTATHV
jgi:alpha-1,4-digalacturonate transport system permease protein